MPVAVLTLRTASPADVAAISEIYNDAVRERGATARLTTETLDERRAWLGAHDERHPVWVAVDGGVVGWLALSRWNEREAYAHSVEVSVYVAAAARGRGIGATLLRHALGNAPRLGVRRMLAGAFSTNTASLALFERHGFERWGHLPGIACVDGVDCDVVWMGRGVG